MAERSHLDEEQSIHSRMTACGPLEINILELRNSKMLKSTMSTAHLTVGPSCEGRATVE